MPAMRDAESTKRRGFEVTWSEMGRFSLACSLLLCWGCSNGDMPPPLGDSDAHVIVVPNDAQAGPCDPPAEGCPCPTGADPLYCGTIYRISGSHVDCAKGYRTCQSDGGWGPCVGPTIFMGD